MNRPGNSATALVGNPMDADRLPANRSALQLAHPLNERLIDEYVADCRKRGLDRQSCNQKKRQLDRWAFEVRWRRPTLGLLNDIADKLKGKRNQEPGE